MSKPTQHKTPQASPDNVGDIAAEVVRLCCLGKCKQAVELAKEEHKLRHTPETQRLLVDAYIARIAQFQGRGALEDADVLIKLVHERFPDHRDRLSALRINAAAAEGKIDVLVAPLATADVSSQTRDAIEEAIRRLLVDLPALAGSAALPADHSLRVAAAAICKALEAVTAGPVTDQQIALPEVSRRSPLAGWKLLVRAIAHFYRNEDDAARRTLAAIPEDAVVHRLNPVLMALMDAKSPGGGAGGALAAAVLDDDRQLRTALEDTEKGMRTANLPLLLQGTRKALAACVGPRAGLAERLRQHLMVRALLDQAPLDRLLKVTGTPPVNSYYWKLEAKGAELRGAMVEGALYWERFLRHAVAEGMIKEGSPEESAVWLRAAQSLSTMTERELYQVRGDRWESNFLTLLYEAQRPDIAALKPTRPITVMVSELSNPENLYWKAVQASPDPEVFKQWWGWAQHSGRSGRLKEPMAEHWHRTLPSDPQPLLILSELAEERNALSTALKHLIAAEVIDPMNPRVRQARLRLTMGILRRHFKEKKAHLVEKDLADLSTLPAMGEGDRIAVMSALHAGWHTLRKDTAAVEASYAAVVGRLGPLAAKLIMDSVCNLVRLGSIPGVPNAMDLAGQSPQAVAQAAARCFVLGEEVGLPIELTWSWTQSLNEVLKQERSGLSTEDLMAVGRYALAHRNNNMAYAASAAGLVTAKGLTAARFLLLRARSLWTGSWRRLAQCLRAALELAKQAHNPELMNEISAAIEKNPSVQNMIAAGGGRELGDHVMADILKAERQASSYPLGFGEADRAVVLMENDSFYRQGSGAAIPWDGGAPFDDEEDEDDYEEDAGPLDGPGDYDMPPGFADALLPMLAKLFGKNGRVPSPQDLARLDPEVAEGLARMIASMDDSKKKKKKR